MPLCPMMSSITVLSWLLPTNGRWSGGVRSTATTHANETTISTTLASARCRTRFHHAMGGVIRYKR